MSTARVTADDIETTKLTTSRTAVCQLLSFVFTFVELIIAHVISLLVVYTVYRGVFRGGRTGAPPTLNSANIRHNADCLA